LPQRGEVAWRLAFLLGLVVAGAAWRGVVLGAYAPQEGFLTVFLVATGMLVGFGARMGNGCTSGHGGCGRGPLSPRPLAAVRDFMATAIATTFLVRHVA